METTQPVKLSLKAKLTYTIGFFGKNVLVILNTYFLLFFYTDVMKIPAAAATVIMLIARVWDAINDPMMGVLCDKTRSKEGKARFWLKYLSVPAGVCVALSYICPDLTTTGRIVWVAITYLFQGMATTMVTVPSNTLMTTMTTDRGERVKLGQFQLVAGAICNFAIPALTMPLVRSFGGGNMEKGFTILAILIGVIYAVSMLIMYWGSKGYDPDTSNVIVQVKTETHKSPSAGALLKAALQNKYALLVCLAYFVYLTMSGIMGSTLVYYFRYNMQNDNLLSLYSTVISIASLLPIVLMGFLCKKLGNANTCILGAVITFVAFIPRALGTDTVIPIFIVTLALVGLGSGLLSGVISQCIMDSTTYGKLHYGVENQGVIMSLYTFFQKFGQAAGGLIASALLAAFSYTAGMEPSPVILKLFYAENIFVPMGVCVIDALLFIVVARMEKKLVADMKAAANA